MDSCIPSQSNSNLEKLELEQQMKELSDVRTALNESSILAITDKQGIITFVNNKFCEISKYTKDELIGNDHRILNSGVHQSDFFKEMWKTIGQGKTWKGEIQNRAKDGSYYWVHTTIVPFLNEIGKPYQYVAIRTDITERKKAEANLQEALMDDFRMTVKNLHNGLFKVKKREDGKIVYTMLEGKLLANINLSTEIHAGKTPYEVFASDIADYKNQQYLKAFQGELVNYEVELEGKTYRCELSPIQQNGEITEIVGSVYDVTEQKKIQELNEYLAFHDELTKLPNRRLFQKKLDQALTEAKTGNQKLAILYLDMDRFKYVNDTLGHTIGDRLLEQIADRLNETMMDRAVLARMGGDEFMVLFPNVKNPTEVIEEAKYLISSLEKPFAIEQYDDLHITASIGISIYPMDGETAEDLMKHADIALYRAKDQGRNRYQIYSTTMNVKTFQSFLLEKDLRRALNQNEFEVYFQPRLDAKTGKLVSAEALLRWNHPQMGMIPPSEFIPLAEETGLILPITSWVKIRVCEHLVSLREQGYSLIPISINISSQRFLQNDFAKEVSQLLERFGLEGRYLEFEITENSLMKNEEYVIQTLNELKEMGIKIFIDDFGTGYSSFFYLKSFSLDGIKIDRSFIHNISQDSKNAAITTAMITMAKHLQMEVVAEGVETEEEWSVLQGENCDQVQGYLFSKPVPLKEFKTYLNNGNLSPMKTKQHHFENRRNLPRVEFDSLLLGKMTILTVKDKRLEVGKSEILIKNVSKKGLQFLSNVKLLFHHSEVIYSFEVITTGQKMKLKGKIIWSKEWDEGIYQYGVELLHVGEPCKTWMKQLNGASLTKTSFLQTDITDFFNVGGN